MKTLYLSKEELRSIRGGAEPNEGFPCTVVEKDGTVKIKIAISVDDCLDYGGIPHS